MDTYRRIVHHFQAAMASGTLCDWEWIIERELGDLHDIEVREPLEVWENMTAKQKFEVVEAVRLSC